MFKRFPSYFSIITAIIFILVGLFITLPTYEILVGVVVVIMGAYVLGSIIRVYLEVIFPEPEKDIESEEQGLNEPDADPIPDPGDYVTQDEHGSQESFNPVVADDFEEPDGSENFNNFFEQKDEFSDEENMDEIEE